MKTFFLLLSLFVPVMLNVIVERFLNFFLVFPPHVPVTLGCFKLKGSRSESKKKNLT